MVQENIRGLVREYTLPILIGTDTSIYIPKCPLNGADVKDYLLEALRQKCLSDSFNSEQVDNARNLLGIIENRLFKIVPDDINFKDLLRGVESEWGAYIDRLKNDFETLGGAAAVALSLLRYCPDFGWLWGAGDEICWPQVGQFSLGGRLGDSQMVTSNFKDFETLKDFIGPTVRKHYTF